MYENENVNLLKDRIEELEKKLEETEAKLLKSEYVFKSVIGLSPICTYIHRGEELYYTNKAGAKLAGTDNPEELIGKSINSIINNHPDYNDIVNERIETLLSNETSVPYMEQKLIKNDGTIMYAEIAGVSFMCDDVMNLLTVIRDVTKRVELEHAFREREELFRGIFENAAVGMALVDLKGKAIKVNSSICEIMGYSEDELLGKTVHDVTHPEDINIEIDNAHKLLENKIHCYHMEKRYFHKDGRIIWSLLSVSLIRNKQGKPLYFICQIQDITNIKQAKEALEYDKLKTEFFANISHELRTPINIIYSSIQLLNMYIENNQLSDNVSKVKGYLDIMKQNCGRTIRLVNNLIDTTKMDTNFYNLNLQNHDIVKIIEDITLSTAEYIEDKGIDLTFDTDIEEKIVACDADKIERIILNLLSNAVKFTEKSGKINVSVQAKKKHIKVSVKDNGIGIQEDKIDLIFERFGQVDRSLVRNHEGSGIGLCLVKSFVEMHGGEITVKSKYGHGSEFIVKLPTKVIKEEKLQEQCKELSKKTKGDFNNHIERVNIEFSDIYL